jgi:DNA-directed RNA polymerase subunit RPC12/RpoP
MPKITMHCSQCGSTNIRATAHARWNAQTQEWRLEDIQENDYAICDDCGQRAEMEARETVASTPARSYRTEFPGFTPNDMPAIPEGWTDTSWCNDELPSFDTNTGLAVYINRKEPALRAHPKSPRFTVMTIATETNVILETENWGDVLTAVAGHKSDRVMRAQNLSNDVIEDALNAACLIIQKHLGITHGDVAGVFFSGPDKGGFATVMRAYARTEAHYMTDEA